MISIKTFAWRTLLFNDLAKCSKSVYFKKKKKKISLLRSPHIFSKFKQMYESSEQIQNKKIDYNLFICKKIHKTLESEYIASFLIIKHY